MFATMARHELKNLLRDRMTVFLAAYPIAIGFALRYLAAEGIIEGQALNISAVLLCLITGFSFGAIAGMSLLDDRDDLVLHSIQISPVPVWKYIWLKITFVYVLALIGGMMIIWISGALKMSLLQNILISALSAMQVPFLAFLINAFAKNKVEGFVAMKGSGFLLVFPVAGFFFLDAKEWLFAIAPGHWAAKAVQHLLLEPAINAGLARMNLGFYAYLMIGFAYNALFAVMAYSMFKRRNAF